MNKFLDIDLVKSLSHSKGYIRTQNHTISSWPSFIRFCEAKYPLKIRVCFYNNGFYLYALSTKPGDYGTYKDTLSILTSDGTRGKELCLHSDADTIVVECFEYNKYYKPLSTCTLKIKNIGKITPQVYILNLPVGRLRINFSL